MRKININITNAKLVSFNVVLDEDRPRVSATIGLNTEQGEQITTYSISNNSWEPDHCKFDLRPEMINAVMGMVEELEVIVTRKCADRQAVLAAPVEESEPDLAF